MVLREEPSPDGRKRDSWDLAPTSSILVLLVHPERRDKRKVNYSVDRFEEGAESTSHSSDADDGDYTSGLVVDGGRSLRWTRSLWFLHFLPTGVGGVC